MDRSLTAYQGLLLDPGWPRWEAQSSYTQAGVTCGTPDPDRATDLALQGSGDQTATVYLSLARSGYPGSGWSAAGLLHRLTGADHWRGWRLPHTCTAWECTDWETPTDSVDHPCAMSLPSGMVLIAHRYTDVVSSRVRVRRRDPSTHAWTVVNVATLPVGFTEPRPCLCRLDDGRVLCAFLASDVVGGYANVAVYYSDDEGATWAILAVPAVEMGEIMDLSAHTLLRLRMAVLDGSVALFGSFLSGTDLLLRQWVSYDRGAHYRKVEDLADHTFVLADDTNGPWSFDVAACAGRLVVAMACPSAGNAEPGAVELRVLGSADQPVSTAHMLTGPLTGGGAPATSWTIYRDEMWVDSVALAVDDDQILYLYCSQPETPGGIVHASTDLVVWQSIDCGTTVERVGISDYVPWLTTSTTSHYWYSADAETYPTDLSACCQRGRVLLAHRAEVDPGTHGDSLFVAYLGGYSDVTMPTLMEWPTSSEGVSWGITWYPYDLPSDVGWTWAGAGTIAITSSGALVAAKITTVANTGYSHRPPVSASLAHGVMGRFVVFHGSGGSLGNDTIAYRVRIGDGAAHDYRVSFRIASTGIRLYDVHAAAILATITTTTSTGVEVEYHLTEDGLVVQWRPWSTSEDHLWTRLGPYACADGGGAVANLVEWGHIDAGDAESYWVESHYTGDIYVGVGWVDWTYPDDLYPRSVSTYPVYHAAGLLLSATTGPGVQGDTWTSAPTYRYGVDQLQVESPRRPWRSLADGVAEYIALAPDGGAAEEALDTDILGVALIDTNVRSVQVQGYDVDTGTWSTLATLSAAVGTGLEWRRFGRTIIPGVAAGATSPYLLRGDLDGGTFTDGATYHTIQTATEGKFGVPTGTAVRQAVVTLTDEGALGASGAAGALYAPRIVGWVKLGGARYSAYRVRITAQDTPEGYYEIGTLRIGPVAVFGHPTAWGRTVETSDGSTSTTYRDGTRAVYAPAPPARLVEVSWVDGIDTTQAFGSSDPDYVLARAGGVAVASPADTPWLLERIYGSLQGDAVVYLPRVTYAGTSASLVRREESVLGYLEGPVRRSCVQGDEAADEVVRIETVTIREIT